MQWPTLSNYATGKDALYPELWDGCIDRICFALGATGLRFINFATPARFGRFTTGDGNGGEQPDYNSRATPDTHWVFRDGILGYRVLNTYDRVCYGRRGAYYDLQNNSPSSISFWVYPESTSADTFLAICSTSSIDRIQIYTNPLTPPSSSGGDICFYNSGVRINVGTNNNLLTLNRWHHIALVIRRSGTTGSAILYLNGNRVGSASGITSSPLNAFYSHGRWIYDLNYSSNNGGCSSPIAEISVFHRAIGEDEIRLLAQHPTIAFVPRRRYYSPLQFTSGSSGSFSGNLDNIIFNFQGSVLVSGSQSNNLSNITTTEQGSVLISSTYSKNLDNFNFSSDGSVGFPVVSGSFSGNLNNINLTSQGNVFISGSHSRTLSNITTTEQGAVLISGNLNKQTDNINFSASSSYPINCSLNQVLQSFELNSSVKIIVNGQAINNLDNISCFIVGSNGSSGSGSSYSGYIGCGLGSGYKRIKIISDSSNS